MTVQEDNFDLSKIVLDGNNQKENLGPVWDKPVPEI